MPGRAQSPQTDRSLVPAELGVPMPRYQSSAVQRDQRRRAEGLDIVDHGRLLQIAVGDRIRRAVARDAALALERLDQRGFLAADIGAGAEMDGDVEVEARLARDRRAEQARGAAAREGIAQRRQQMLVLAAQVEETPRRADAYAQTVMPSNTRSA